MIDGFLEEFSYVLIVFFATSGVALIISRIFDMSSMGVKVVSVLITQLVVTALLAYMLGQISESLQGANYRIGVYYAAVYGGVLWVFGLVAAVLSAHLTVAWLRRRSSA